MTSSSMPEQEHGRSPPETVTMASGDEAQLQLPGLGDPTAGRSDAATSIMVTTGGAGDDEEELVGTEGPLGGGDIVLVGTPWGLILAPTPLSSMKQDDDDKKKCVRCGATETPQWRTQPVGRGALCNACRIRLRPAEALREPVRVHALLPPPATKEPAPAPAPEEKTQKKRKRKPWRPRKSSNLKQPEHRGKEQQHQAPQPRAGDGMEQHLRPPPPAKAHAGGGDDDERLLREPNPPDQMQQDAVDGSPETHAVYGVGGGDLQMGDDPSSLDEFLFVGPAAPMLIDDDEGLVD